MCVCVFRLFARRVALSVRSRIYDFFALLLFFSLSRALSFSSHSLRRARSNNNDDDDGDNDDDVDNGDDCYAKYNEDIDEDIVEI